MIQKVANVAVVVKDQAKALDFYTQVLGFEKRMDIPAPSGGARWVTVAPKGQDIEISLFLAGSYPDTQNQWKAGSSPMWTLQTDDCRAEYARLKARGVRFDQEEPAENPWSITATFSDPDGNRFNLAELRRKS